ncbi:uncharacterized protein LOC111401540 isoform X2 [Olea europaea var. sylvestris]|uniref:uncharacterized protein LOC111401540 isoform X2 n=1 Tax=Olea europaea var. sylvestris TaxID=158386 RepID=UPI000C1D00E8|nr:uncharacterized protein LOC111401540 isoform X2 [Olea europaea var. sylvestris]
MLSLNGITIQGKRLYVALVLYDAEKMRSCPLNYPTQSFYTKNLDVITSEFRPLHYDFPHYSPWDHTAYQIVPIPQLNSWDPNLGDISFTACPNSGYLSLILRSSESPRNHFHTYPSTAKSAWEYQELYAKIHSVFTQNPMESTKDKKLSSIFQNKIINGVTIKDQKPSRKLQNKRINGVAEKFSQGSETTKPVSATCSPGDMYYYPVKIVQYDKVNGQLFEMKMSDT